MRTGWIRLAGAARDKRLSYEGCASYTIAVLSWLVQFSPFRISSILLSHLFLPPHLLHSTLPNISPFASRPFSCHLAILYHLASLCCASQLSSWQTQLMAPFGLVLLQLSSCHAPSPAPSPRPPRSHPLALVRLSSTSLALMLNTLV